MKELHRLNGDDEWEVLVTKKDALLYAEKCMINLLTKYPNGKDGVGEISNADLRRIKDELNKNNHEKT